MVTLRLASLSFGTAFLRHGRASLLIAFVALSLLSAPSFASSVRGGVAAATVVATDLRTEHLVSPMSVDTPTPRLGWRIESSARDVMQTSYHIIVASTPDKAARHEGDLWDVTVGSDRSQWVAYQGKPLASNTRCYWSVQLETTQGPTPWSDVAQWNVGLLTEGDWRGRWIGLDSQQPTDVETEHSRLPARYLRHEFTLDKAVSQATLYISGLGLYEAFINGHRVGDQVLAPPPTDYRRTVVYNAYDVTSLLASRNAIGVALGNGRYYTMQQNKKPYKITRFGRPTLRANLIVEYADGSRQTIATDERWRLTTEGPIRSNNEYDGETYDARQELGAWTLPGYDDSRWQQAERTAIPYGTLRGAMMAGMKVVGQLKPRSVVRRNGCLIVDMGQNMAGWLKVRMAGLSRGDSVVIRFAERLDSTGNIWTDNLRHAQSTDRYYANGLEGDATWWHPAFVYHGFRYAEVSGIKGLTADDIVGEVVSDAMETTGSFATTDTMLSRIYHNAYWGILSNYKGMPVDCPQRDERQPWLGDRTRGCYGEAFLFDNHALYAKWVRDIVEAQREDGSIPDVAPAFWNYYSDDLTWAAALPMALHMLMGHYGDDRPLRRYYPNVKRWLEHLRRQYQRDGLMHCGKYGDWCVPPEREDLIHSEDPARKTDVTLISSAYYYYLCRAMAGYARMQQLGDDAEWFEDEAAATKAAFNREFLTVRKGTTTVPGHILYPDSTYYGNNTVTANLLPYVFGMIDDSYVSREVEKQVVKAIVSQNLGTITTGVIGTGWLMHALTQMGRTDLAWLLATNKKYPSWGYMANHGATTIWELWNGDTASPKMNSGNHVMLLGDLLSWLYECVAGIGAADVGYKHIAMAPDFSVDEIDDIDASYQSIYGRIVSRWRKDKGTLYWHVEIPANTKATLRLPGDEMMELGSGSYDLERPLPRRGSQVVADEFLYRRAPFPECHSASIVETRRGDLVATYFGGTKERNPDVCIYVSRKPKGATDWTEPMLVADGVGIKDGNQADTTPGQREACWNPVLFETPDGQLQLYFKIGPNVAGWKGWRVTSDDGGRTWSRREMLPDSIYGPIKNKPVLVATPNGPRLIAPTSDERHGWKVYFELSDDMGRTWRRTNYVEADSGVLAIQPTIITLPDGTLQALCRTRSRHIGVTRSTDNGETWSKLDFLDTPNNNSGIDAVGLSGGGYALICNDWPIEPDKTKGARTPLSILRSDDGTNWSHWITLEDSPILQYSYPSIIQSRDGHLHAVYTWRRQRVKHVELIP